MELADNKQAVPESAVDTGQESAIETDYYRFAVGADKASFALRGDWTILSLAELEGIVERLDMHRIPAKDIEFECGGLKNFDLSGAWLLFAIGNRTSPPCRCCYHAPDTTDQSTT